MPRRVYVVDAEQSRVVATARSSVHDTEATFGSLRGTIEADLDALAEPGGVVLELAVDMTAADAGDALRTRKLRKDIDSPRYPEAQFSLERVVHFERDASGLFEASGEGIMRWRDREMTIQPRGRGTLDETRIAAEASFSLDIRDFGVAPPKFLMLKVEPEVAVKVELAARAA